MLNIYFVDFSQMHRVKISDFVENEELVWYFFPHLSSGLVIDVTRSG